MNSLVILTVYVLRKSFFIKKHLNSLEIFRVYVLPIIHSHITYSFFLHPSKKAGKDKEAIQSSTTPGPGYHMEK